MNIPFTKAHGAGNDFLLTWQEEAPAAGLPELARAICERHTGVGADGWMLVSRNAGDDCDAGIRLFNSDGSEPELSGNGTRCAAAFLLRAGFGAETIRIRTGAGIKHLRLLSREGLRFSFEMNMGRPKFPAERFDLQLADGAREVTLVWVGNPQCVVFVKNFEFDWRRVGAEIETHPHFADRTNVSFVRVVNRDELDVRFYERGAGETMSSGTGSTGAFAAAVQLGLAAREASVLTPAGPLALRWTDAIYLAGPAEITADGTYFATALVRTQELRK